MNSKKSVNDLLTCTKTYHYIYERLLVQVKKGESRV